MNKQDWKRELRAYPNGMPHRVYVRKRLYKVCRACGQGHREAQRSVARCWRDFLRVL